MDNKKRMLENILSSAGIIINGKNPWDVVVNDPNIYNRIFRDGDIGAGEGYILREWDCLRLDELVHKINLANLEDKLFSNIRIKGRLILEFLLEKVKYYNAYTIGKKHYDLGNELFEAMLDKRMVYTCGYWKNAETLDEAQENKLDLVCKKLQLKSGMRILDIGGGWGSFAKFAAEKYKVSVVNITVSKEQVAMANKLCVNLPVENRLQDYREINDAPYDRIVSLGMFEHVRSGNYKKFMEIVHHNLKRDGLFLLHTIGDYRSTGTGNASWITKYIFPNSEIPSFSDLTNALKNIFVVEDLHNFGTDYDKTLMAWYSNFLENWPELKDQYGDKFFRIWKYYLLGSAGMFRARKLHLWQLVLSKNGILGGYASIR